MSLAGINTEECGHNVWAFLDMHALTHMLFHQFGYWVLS